MENELLTQNQVNRPKKLFLVEKLTKFHILRNVIIIVSQTPYQNTFDPRLSFEEHLKEIITKINKAKRLLRKF